MKAKTIKIISFDVSNTLFMDNDPKLLFDIYKSEFQILRKYSSKLKYSYYLRAVEETWRDCQKVKVKEGAFLKILLKKINIKYSKELSNIIEDNFNKISKVDSKHSTKQKLSKNAMGLIKYLVKQNYILAIISDTKSGWIREWIKNQSFSKQFKYFSLSSEVGGKKASGKPYLDFIRQIKKDGFLPNQVLHIGDLSVDVQAKNYGINVALYNPLHLPDKHFLTKPDYIVDDLINVKDILSKENSI
jgi:FMN phosphatase YigB (HAD superfamily)